MNKKDLEIVDNFLSTVTSLDPTGASGFIVDGFKTILSIRDKIYLSKYQEFWRAPEENKIKIEDFNNLINTVVEFNESWEVPALDSWHSRFF